jgi:hypothetical protein
MSAVLLVSGALSSACERKKTPLEEMNLTPDQAQRILAEITGKRAEAPPPRAPKSAGDADPAPSGSAMNRAPGESVSAHGWVVDGLVDVAPAAPSTASAQGVTLINSKNELFLAELGKLPRQPTPQQTPVRPLTGAEGPFAMGRGPSLAGGRAFWITSHYLLSRPLKPPFEPLDVLAEDARVGTRTAALEAAPNQARPVWVAYVALPTVKDGPLRGKLWYGGEQELVLSVAGTSTLSVDLVETGSRVFAVSLEARTGQSNLHARPLLPGDPPKTGEDRVIWVGGGSNPTTELRIAQNPSSGAKVLGLLPLEQDITHFGIATLGFSDLTEQNEARVRWIPYANGINPAPLDTARVCGKDILLFARPTSADPGSPQELVFGELNDGVMRTSLVVAHSKAFYDISLAPVAHGALVSYVADYRTWALTVRCTWER